MESFLQPSVSVPREEPVPVMEALQKFAHGLNTDAEIEEYERRRGPINLEYLSQLQYTLARKPQKPDMNVNDAKEVRIPEDVWNPSTSTKGEKKVDFSKIMILQCRIVIPIKGRMGENEAPEM